MIYRGVGSSGESARGLILLFLFFSFYKLLTFFLNTFEVCFKLVTTWVIFWTVFSICTTFIRLFVFL